MLKDLTPQQRALADYMSDLSEQAFSAGWIENLEHALWRAVEVGPYRYGHLDLSTEHVENLKHLSASCGGWIHFRGEAEETFVPVEGWMQVFEPARST